MALLDRFRKSRRPKQEEAAPSPVPVQSSTKMESEPPKAATEEADSGAQAESKLEEARKVFEQIHSVIDTEHEPEEQEADPGAIELTLTKAELLELIPSSFRMSVDDDNQERNVEINLIIPEGLEKLTTGRVTLPLSDLTEKLPTSWMTSGAQGHMDDEIDIPLQLVVEATSPDMLQQHHKAPERDSGLDLVPNPFSKDAFAADAPAPEKSPESEDADQTATAEEKPTEAEKPKPEPVPEVEPEAELVPEPEAAPEPEIEEEKAEQLFAADQILETAEAAEEQKVPVAEDVTPEAKPDFETMAPPVQPEPQPITAVPFPDAPPVVVHDTNVNTATIKQLTDLPSVGPHIAAAIAENRPYETVYDLGKIHGIGRRLFHRLTKMHLPPSGVTADAFSEILGDPKEKMLPLREIADRIAAMRGISSCILGHEDGHVMASSTKNRDQKFFGAIAPQITKSIKKYLSLMDVDEPQSFTLFLEPRPVFVTRSESVLLIAFVPRSGISMRRTNFLEALCCELVQRLHRHMGANIDPVNAS